MIRQYIDDGMGNKIDVTTIDGKPFVTSADKANAITIRELTDKDIIEFKRAREKECTVMFLPENMTLTHTIDNDGKLIPLHAVPEDKHYGELVLNIILIAAIIAALVIAYNLGFAK